MNPHRLFPLLALLCLPALAQTPPPPPASRPFNPAEVSASLTSAKPGDTLQIHGLDLATTPRLPITITTVPNSPPLVFSDKPEYFRSGNGIALQEDVPAGRFRLYVYHVPEPTGAQKVITAIAENLSDSPATLTFHRYAFPSPGGDYHNIAKQAMAAFLAKSPAPAAIATRTIPPHSRIVIDPVMEVPVKKDILVHGWYELETTQPLKITTLQRDLTADSTKVVDTLEKLPKVLPGFHASGAGRGVFPDTEFTVAPPAPFNTATGIVQLVLADGTPNPDGTPSWIQGRDSISNESGPDNLNKGNYGALYHIRIPYTSTDGRSLALVVANARSDGKWCRYAAMSVLASAGHHPAGIIRLPADKVRYDGLPEAALIQTFPPPPPGTTATLEITYTPPGASCLPQNFILIPYTTK